VARFGADIALTDLLMALATCDRRKDFSRPCGERSGLRLTPASTAMASIGSLQAPLL
jgi:hypothetical protein